MKIYTEDEEQEATRGLISNRTELENHHVYPFLGLVQTPLDPPTNQEMLGVKMHQFLLTVVNGRWMSRELRTSTAEKSAMKLYDYFDYKDRGRVNYRYFCHHRPLRRLVIYENLANTADYNMPELVETRFRARMPGAYKESGEKESSEGEDEEYEEWSDEEGEARERDFDEERIEKWAGPPLRIPTRFEFNPGDPFPLWPSYMSDSPAWIIRAPELGSMEVDSDQFQSAEEGSTSFHSAEEASTSYHSAEGVPDFQDFNAEYVAAWDAWGESDGMSAAGSSVDTALEMRRILEEGGSDESLKIINARRESNLRKRARESREAEEPTPVRARPEGWRDPDEGHYTYSGLPEQGGSRRVSNLVPDPVIVVNRAGEIIKGGPNHQQASGSRTKSYIRNARLVLQDGKPVRREASLVSRLGRKLNPEEAAALEQPFGDLRVSLAQRITDPEEPTETGYTAGSSNNRQAEGKVYTSDEDSVHSVGRGPSTWKGKEKERAYEPEGTEQAPLAGNPKGKGKA